tara:strand:- start:102 stop:383 length:282 start_codon:yes stop_codon:yes gene_type:complete
MGSIMNKNTYCYISEVGNKNFYYPTSKKCIVKNNAEYETMPWLCSDRTLRAIKVKNKYIVDLTFEQNSIILDDIDKYSIVWIKKENLPLSSAG